MKRPADESAGRRDPVSGERQLFPSPDGRAAPPELVKKKKLKA